LDEILSLAISYFIGLATMATPYSFSKMRNYWKNTYPFVKFWRPMISGKLNIITVGETKGEPEKSSVYDYLALKEAIMKFEEFYKGKFEHTICDYAAERCKMNLLLIGGTQANSIAKRVIEVKKELKYYFRVDKYREVKAEERNDIMCRDDPNFIFRPQFKDHLLVKDYALITKCANELKEGCATIVVAGSHGQGTYGGMKALLDTSNLKFLNNMKEEYFQVLVSTEVVKTAPQEPILLQHTFTRISGY
jgi:hypothetical protein